MQATIDKFVNIAVVIVIAVSLSACVTKKYSDKDKQVVERDFSSQEKALTRITLGLGYLNMGNTSQAKLNLERAKQFAPKMVDVYTAFAHYFEVVGEVEQAINSYETALSLDQNNADALNNYGVFLCRQNQVEKAEQQWLKAIAVPEYLKVSESYENIALCQLDSNQFEKAEISFTKALDHSPQSSSILYRLAQLYYAKREYAKTLNMVSHYERATRKFQPEVLALAYKTHVNLNNSVEAGNYANMLVKMFPKSDETKAFITNQLRNIPADELAKRYREYTFANNLQSPENRQLNQKKVIKFSPKSNAITTETTSTKPPMQVTTVVASEDKLSEPSKTGTEPAISQDIEQVKQMPSVIAPSTQEQQISANGGKMLTIPVHVMQKGESLFTVSRQYNITMKALQRWNSIRQPNKLKLGQVIYLADPKKAAAKQ